MNQNPDCSTWNIEQGVPPPPKRNNRKSKWFDLASSMRPGDSVIVDGKGEANSLTYIIRYYGAGASHQRLTDGQYRVWKLAHP